MNSKVLLQPQQTNSQNMHPAHIKMFSSAPYTVQANQDDPRMVITLQPVLKVNKKQKISKNLSAISNRLSVPVNHLIMQLQTIAE